MGALSLSRWTCVTQGPKSTRGYSSSVHTSRGRKKEKQVMSPKCIPSVWEGQCISCKSQTTVVGKKKSCWTPLKLYSAPMHVPHHCIRDWWVLVSDLQCVRPVAGGPAGDAQSGDGMMSVHLRIWGEEARSWCRCPWCWRLTLTWGYLDEHTDAHNISSTEKTALKMHYFNQ